MNIDLSKDCKITEHLMELPGVCAHHNTSVDMGLSEEEAKMRLARDGPNAFTPPKQTAWWILYLKEMSNGIALLLWFSAIASFISYPLSPTMQDVSSNNSLSRSLLIVFAKYLRNI